MSKRINITMPDKLFELLQEVKDNINVSKICQRAIEQAVYREKSFENTDDGERKFIARLRREREEEAQIYKKTGYEYGVKNAYTMPFTSLYHIQRRQYDHTPSSLFYIYADKELYEKVKKEEVPELEFGGMTDLMESFEEFEDLFIDGWLSGVLDVWDDVKDKLKTDEQGDFDFKLDEFYEEEL